VSQNIRSFNLETAVGRKKDAQGIGVHREIKKFVVTLLVMRHFFIVRGAPRACVDFCDPTAVSRIMGDEHVCASDARDRKGYVCRLVRLYG
jgi:hypothetical protein